MVSQERSPALRRRLFRAQQVFRNRRLRHLDAELEQFPVNPRRTPGRVGFLHRPDEIDDVARHLWATWSAATALPAPQQSEAMPMPCDHGLWLHQDQGAAPARPEAR